MSKTMAHPSPAELNQRKRHQRLVAGMFLAGTAILVFILYIGLKLDPKHIPSTLVGKPAYDFQAGWLLGEEHLPEADPQFFTLDDLIGRNIILNFWASWCVTCREESYELEAFWKAYKDQNVIVVGIAIQDTKESAVNFARYYGKGYPLGMDLDGKIAIDYGVTGVPETFLINTQGEVVRKFVGPVDVAQLRQALKYFN